MISLQSIGKLFKYYLIVLASISVAYCILKYFIRDDLFSAEKYFKMRNVDAAKTNWDTSRRETYDEQLSIYSERSVPNITKPIKDYVTVGPGDSNITSKREKISDSSEAFSIPLQYGDETVKNISVIKHCSQSRHVFYNKAHKTGSSTLNNMFFMYALRHNLKVITFPKESVSFPDKNMMKYMNRHPAQMKGNHSAARHALDTDTKFDISCNHAVFDQKHILKVMPKDTVFVGSLRHPFSHLISSFSYFRLADRFELKNLTNPMHEFLRKPALYDKPFILGGVSGRLKLALSRTKNIQAFEYGFDLKKADSKSYIKDYILYLNKTFAVIILTERFDEGLILLKRALCLDFLDIMYLEQNARYQQNHSFQDPVTLGSLYTNHRRWTSVDYAMYEFFLEEHERRINELGDGFSRELNVYKRIKDDVQTFCHDIAINLNGGRNDSTKVRSLLEKSLFVKETVWNDSIKISGGMCLMMMLKTHLMLKITTARQYHFLCNESKPVVSIDKKFCHRNNANGEVKIPRDTLFMDQYLSKYFHAK